MSPNKSVLITGANGFTGHHLKYYLQLYNFKCIELQSDLLDYETILEEITDLNPDYIIHLAAISYSAESDINLIYSVNVIGSENLLKAIVKSKISCKRCILASSASVYGNNGSTNISEEASIAPINHYGISKYAMECISRNYKAKIPIVITRPFNYTGLNQDKNFLIPKIIKAFQSREDVIELGNIDVFREFNDVRDIVQMYRLLITSEYDNSCLNLCSGEIYSISNIIDFMQEISDHKIEITINDNFIRDNEIKELGGDPSNIQKSINYIKKYNIRDTLKWMYKNE